MYTRIIPGDTIVASADIPTADGTAVHYLRVVADNDRSEEVFAFLWATTDEDADPFAIKWGEHWRGNLRACMRGFTEVTEDLAAEALLATPSR